MSDIPAPASPWRRAYERAMTAPHLPVAIYLIYIGTRALTDADTRIIVTTLPGWFANSWAAALLAGGLLIGAGVLTASPRTESAGHACHLAGLAIYTVAATAAGLFGTGLVFVLFTLAGVSAIRLRELHRARAARVLATHIVRGD